MTSLAGRFNIAEPPTTDGMIALLNLQAEIDGQEAGAVDRRTVGAQVALVELISLRGLILGHVADYERAEALAEQSVRMAPSNAAAFVVRARARATFHRFADALNDLDVAQRLSADAVLLGANAPQSFKRSGVTRTPWTSVKQPRISGRASKQLELWQVFAPSSGRWKRLNDFVWRPGAATAVSRRFRLRFSISSLAGCAWTLASWTTREHGSKLR